ncbi:MAG: hypothetical protein QME45_14695 [Clostridiales bacterium]|nr:hypothetical protein [Clostridiales bacterium]
MKRKLPVLILAVVILLQAFTLAVFAASKNEGESRTACFCSSDLTSEGAGKVAKTVPAQLVREGNTATIGKWWI